MTICSGYRCSPRKPRSFELNPLILPSVIQLASRQVVEREVVAPRHGLVEVRLDDEPRGVGGDQQRQVFEVLAVLFELGERGFEVAVLALVLEGEEVLLSDAAQPLPPLRLAAPRSNVNEAPVLSEATGVACPTRAHRSLKCET
jgi:hypothetical protein